MSYLFGAFKRYGDADDSCAMSTDWKDLLLERLDTSARPDGGWGYAPGAAPFAEPSALTCLALSAWGMETRALHNGLALLARMQRPDGSVPVALDIESPC